MKGPAFSILRTYATERDYQLAIHRLETEQADLSARLRKMTDDALTVNRLNLALDRKLQVTIAALREFLAEPICSCGNLGGSPIICVPHRALEALAAIDEATCRRSSQCVGCIECGFGEGLRRAE
jgi:hypothetical protein